MPDIVHYDDIWYFKIYNHNIDYIFLSVPRRNDFFLVCHKMLYSQSKE